MGRIQELWAAGEMPFGDALYRPDDTALALRVEGPGAYHPDAGQPAPFRVGGPVDVARIIEEDGTLEAGPCFERPLPDGSGRITGGGGGMGNIGHLARIAQDGTLCWVAVMYLSNPFVAVRFEGSRAVFTDDWRNLLTLDLAAPPLAP